MKRLILFTSYLSLLSGKINAQNQPIKSKADSAWEALPKADLSKFRNDRIGEIIYFENFKRDFYSTGLKFWRRFPEDKRKYIWLERTSHFYAPAYWKNIEEAARLSVQTAFISAPIDEQLFKDWSNTISENKPVFLNDPKVKGEERQIFKGDELDAVISSAKNKEYWKNKQVFWSRISQSFNDAIEGLKDFDNCASLLRSIEKLFLGTTNYGIEINELKEFVGQYCLNENSAINQWAKSKLRLLNSDMSNFAIFNDSISAGKLVFSKFKNKVVLVDLWNIYCSTCIERMKVFKPLYEKYGKAGFEIVSVSIDPETNRDKAEKINREFGGDWVHILIGGKNEEEHKSPLSQSRRLWRAYAFQSVPQLLLFNKQGKLIMYNGPLLFGDPEVLIQSAINE